MDTILHKSYIGYSFKHGSYVVKTSVADVREDAYLRGKKDGAKDMQIELLKRGDALYNLAFQKVEQITSILLESAEQHSIKIFEFHLKVENWDCLKSLILVDIEDFASDKIEELYRAANECSDKFNDTTFHWDYSITYSSDNFNKDKIVSDGFTHFYEHLSTTRPTQ